MPGDLSPYPLSATGGRRRRNHKRRGGAEGDVTTTMPGTAMVAGALKAAGAEASEVNGVTMEGGRRRKMTAKKVVKKLHSLAKQAKKLTLRLKKMKKHH